jgi:hypothetical protein
MESTQLNQTIVTLMQAFKILSDCPRKMHPDGTVTISLARTLLDDQFNNDIFDATRTLHQIPELATMLEIRILEIQTQAAMKRLKAITG